jgi:hypothetical protein
VTSDSHHSPHSAILMRLASFCSLFRASSWFCSNGGTPPTPPLACKIVSTEGKRASAG